jgi:hypothetical protein
VTVIYLSFLIVTIINIIHLCIQKSIQIAKSLKKLKKK